MKLVVFDIDGTLANTSDVDTDCFADAVTEVFEIQNLDTNWSNYRHVTDSGIIAEILANHQISSTTDQIRQFKRTFLRNLRSALEKSPQKFSEVAGAREVVEFLSNHRNFQVAFASGGFEATARLKLSHIGIDCTLFPTGFSDDSSSRSQIISYAIKRALAKGTNFERITYVGDGVWDARACKELEIPFVGRANGERASLLESEGAIGVVPDFRDPKFMELLQ